MGSGHSIRSQWKPTNDGNKINKLLRCNLDEIHGFPCPLGIESNGGGLQLKELQRLLTLVVVSEDDRFPLSPNIQVYPGVSASPCRSSELSDQKECAQ